MADLVDRIFVLITAAAASPGGDPDDERDTLRTFSVDPGLSCLHVLFVDIAELI